MLISPIDTKPISYSRSSLFAISEGDQLDWGTEASYVITDGATLPQFLTLVWKVSHQRKDRGYERIECSIISNEFRDQKRIRQL